MTSTAITGASASDLQSLLRDRLQAKIKTSFVELIPEELFNAMLDSATDEFLHGPRSKRHVRSELQAYALRKREKVAA